MSYLLQTHETQKKEIFKNNVSQSEVCDQWPQNYLQRRIRDEDFWAPFRFRLS